MVIIFTDFLKAVIYTLKKNKKSPDESLKIATKAQRARDYIQTKQTQQEGHIMKVYTETSLTNFEFWSGAKDTVKYLTDEELETIETMLEDIYPDGIDETELNDFFWFEDDTIAEWLGYNDFEEIMNRDE